MYSCNDAFRSMNVAMIKLVDLDASPLIGNYDVMIAERALPVLSRPLCCSG